MENVYSAMERNEKSGRRPRSLVSSSLQPQYLRGILTTPGRISTGGTEEGMPGAASGISSASNSTGAAPRSAGFGATVHTLQQPGRLTVPRRSIQYLEFDENEEILCTDDDNDSDYNGGGRALQSESESDDDGDDDDTDDDDDDDGVRRSSRNRNRRRVSYRESEDDDGFNPHRSGRSGSGSGRRERSAGSRSTSRNGERTGRGRRSSSGMSPNRSTRAARRNSKKRQRRFGGSSDDEDEDDALLGDDSSSEDNSLPDDMYASSDSNENTRGRRHTGAARSSGRLSQGKSRGAVAAASSGKAKGKVGKGQVRRKGDQHAAQHKKGGRGGGALVSRLKQAVGQWRPPDGLAVNRQWLQQDIVHDCQYCPQLGDRVVYFPQGHKDSFGFFKEQGSPPWLDLPARYPLWSAWYHRSAIAFLPMKPSLRHVRRLWRSSRWS